MWCEHLHLNSSHHSLLRSWSQEDLRGDVEGLVRCYQSPQQNHPLTQHHHSPCLIFPLFLLRLKGPSGNSSTLLVKQVNFI